MNTLYKVPSFGANNRAVAPAAGQVIADLGQLPMGWYEIDAAGSYGGIADVIDNMALLINGEQFMVLPVAPVANSAPFWVFIKRVPIPQGGRVQIASIAAGGAGSVFRGTLLAIPADY